MPNKPRLILNKNNIFKRAAKCGYVCKDSLKQIVKLLNVETNFENLEYINIDIFMDAILEFRDSDILNGLVYRVLSLCDNNMCINGYKYDMCINGYKYKNILKEHVLYSAKNVEKFHKMCEQLNYLVGNPCDIFYNFMPEYETEFCFSINDNNIYTRSDYFKELSKLEAKINKEINKEKKYFETEYKKNNKELKKILTLLADIICMIDFEYIITKMEDTINSGKTSNVKNDIMYIDQKITSMEQDIINLRNEKENLLNKLKNGNNK